MKTINIDEEESDTSENIIQLNKIVKVREEKFNRAELEQKKIKIEIKNIESKIRGAEKEKEIAISSIKKLKHEVNNGPVFTTNILEIKSKRSREIEMRTHLIGIDELILKYSFQK